ncbi:MAG: hypothetical protein GX927_10100 [Lentisphaerae bacterium]|jgi:hypothetical protein|nr:hypothetical protein [Lentisphaerota bacterium]
MKKLSFCLLLLFSFMLHAVPSASFHAEFDQDFHALGGPGGSTPGKHSQEALWETLAANLRPGVVGQAAIIGASEDKKQGYCIVYPAKDIINPDVGSVAFWVQMMNWSVDDKSYHVFFRAQGKDADLIVYKTPGGAHLTFLIGPRRKNEEGKNIWASGVAQIPNWKVGEWHFVVATWGNGLAELYVDGLQAKTFEYEHAPGEFRVFGAGGLYPTQWQGHPQMSLIDELMVYKGVKLTPNDVRLRYVSYGRGFMQGDDTTPIKPEQLVTLVDQKSKIINVQFQLNHAQSDGKPFEALVEFIGDGENVVYQKRFTSDIPKYVLPVPEDAIPVGDYNLKVTVCRSNGQIAGYDILKFQKPQRPAVWEGNSIGISDKVPPPWTPLEFDNKQNAITCWNRSYHFNDSVFPEKIVSGDATLLSSPVRLMLDGRKIDAKAQIADLKVTGAEVDFVATAANPVFALRNVIHAEYDGFIWFDLTLTPVAGKEEVKSLALEFPFAKAASTLFNSMTKYYLEYRPGACGSFKNYSMDLYRVPRVMFVGNDNVGLEWVCESMDDWYNKQQARALELLAGQEENLLKLNLIDHPVTIDRPLTFSFGIQATPVRPLPDKWRLLRLRLKNGKSLQPFWEPTRHHASINEADLYQDHLERRAKAEKTYGRVLLYLAGFTNNPFYPEWPYWCLTWSKTGPDPGFYGALGNPAATFAWNCPVPNTQREWYLYTLKNFTNKYNYPDLYFDNQCAQLCNNAAHGCGWKGTDGNTYPTYNLRATRDLTKRIYSMAKERDPNCIIMRHMSAKMVTPTVGFADILADGELFCKTVGVDESYYNVFSPDMFRAAFRTQPYGIPNYYIPQFQRAIRYHGPIKNRYFDAWTHKHLYLYREKLRHFIGYALVHDTLVWPDSGIAMDYWYDLQDDFGFDGTERFVLYNDPASPFKSTDELLMVSCYTLKGKTLIVIMNDTKNPVKGVSYDPAKFAALGVGFTELYNPETGETIAVKNGVIDCNIAARDYQLLVSGPCKMRKLDWPPLPAVKKAAPEATSPEKASSSDSSATESFVVSDKPDFETHSEQLVKRLKRHQSKNRYSDYQALLQELSDKHRYRVLRGRDFAGSAPDPDKITVYLRHDIDMDPFTALRMARDEKRAGLFGSYYVLHSAGYYGKVEKGRVVRYSCMDRVYQELYSMGHEVGIHQDLMTLMVYHDIDPLPFQRKELAYYQSIGIPISGTASHGGIVNRLGLNNTFIFSEFKKKGTYEFEGRTCQYGNLSLADFGFEYEGYLPKTQARLSDISNYPGKELPAKLRTCKKGDMVSLLIHPLHWKDDDETTP